MDLNWQKKEISLVALMSLLLILITAIPYIYLQYQTPTEYIYSGATYINPADNFIYYSYINQAKQGAWLIDNLYTGEETLSTIRPLWTILGKVAYLFDWSAQFTFHFFRILLIPILVLTAYYCIGLFTSDLKNKVLSLILFLFSAGFGWLWMLFKPLFWLQDAWQASPFDFIRAFAFPFLSALTSPHFIASWILIILVVSFSYKFLQEKGIALPIATGLLTFLLFLIHPFSIPLIFILSFGWWFYQVILNKKLFSFQSKNIFLFFIFSSPAVLYYTYLSLFDLTTVVKTMQNYLISPKIEVTMISFGPIMLLAILGLIKIFKYDKKDLPAKFLLWWMIVNGLLIYLPVLWQRRLAQGWFFPLTVLAGVYLYKVNNKMGGKIKDWQVKKYFIFVPLMVVLLLSNINVLVLIFFFRQQDSLNFYYYPKTIEQVGGLLREQSRSGDVIFANTIRDSIFLPAFSDKKVYLGHSVETLYIESKANRLEWFFGSNTMDDKKEIFLINNGIDYIVFNNNENSIYRPDEKEYLNMEYGNKDYNVYKFLNNEI